MPTSRRQPSFHALILTALLGIVGAVPAHAEDAGGLQARHAELRESLRNNDFGRAIHIESSETGDRLAGDVYAVLDHPFKLVSEALKEPSGWCDIMMLPFNTKYCRARASASDAAALDVRIGRTPSQPVKDAYRINFVMTRGASSADFFESSLSAPTGPVGTKDYRIVVSAVPLADGKSFMHLSYSYGYGFAGRVAMQAFMSTAGAGKVGFSRDGKDGNGEPVLIGGTRGAIERNAMRYYLAIDAHLRSLSAPPEQRLDRRIALWFNASERYARQLHEMDRSRYVALKRDDYERAQTDLQ